MNILSAMALADLSPLSYFKELHLFPRVIFTIGGVLFLGFLFVGNVALVFLGLGLIFGALAFNFMLNSRWYEPGPPYSGHLAWQPFLQGLLALALAIACLYVAAYCYHYGFLPFYLRPIHSSAGR